MNLREWIAEAQAHPEAYGDFSWSQLAAVALDFGERQWGAYTGTGLAIPVTLRFDPKLVILVDSTLGRAAIHFSGMADGTAMGFLSASNAMIAANGITLGTKQFTIGTDANINGGGDVGFWFAIG